MIKKICPACKEETHKDDPMLNEMCAACNEDINYILDVMGDSPKGWIRRRHNGAR